MKAELNMTKHFASAQNKKELSAREEQVLETVAWGASYEEAGDLLGITSRTIDNHLRKIKEKLQLQKVSELSAYYFCTKYNISFDLSPLKEKIIVAGFLLLSITSEFNANQDQFVVARRRPRRTRTECRYTVRARASKGSSY